MINMLYVYVLFRHIILPFAVTVATAKAAKSLQSCLTVCDPIDGSPRGSSAHGIFQTRVLEWVVIAFSRKTATAAAKSL